MIADVLKVPRRTVSFWLKDYANDIGDDIAKSNGNGKIGIYSNGNIKYPITLYPCQYEEAQKSKLLIHLHNVYIHTIFVY